MDRINYACTECNYEFSRKQGLKFMKCPYCGREGTVDLKKGNYASRILEEI